MQHLLTARMVEMTFAPATDIADWFNRIGLEAQIQNSGVVVLRNPGLNFTTAISDALDPINRAVCLASAIAGPHHFPEIFPRLLEAVNKEWKARAKVETGKQKWQTEHPSPTTSASAGPATFEMLYRRIEF